MNYVDVIYKKKPKCCSSAFNVNVMFSYSR